MARLKKPQADVGCDSGNHNWKLGLDPKYVVCLQCGTDGVNWNPIMRKPIIPYKGSR